ncbi:ACP S-malonyltransferase [Candidatus Margulisiibacteriota bacterium]
MKAFIFPGQGSQSVGMGRGLDTGIKLFDRANDVLGYDLKKIVFEGPEDLLTKTENAQPAILTCSIAMLEALDEEQPDIVAGHSLGEYTALVAAGVLSFEDAVKLVNTRGKLMEKAVPAGKGAMAAIIGLEEEKLTGICREVDGIVDLANINTPVQIVISGESDAVKSACAGADAAGAKRVVPLTVSGPFHSLLMKEIAEEFSAELEKYNFKDALIPVVSNVLAEKVQSADQIKELLVKQLYSPVLWRQTIENMVKYGVTDFKEVGPGKVLTGMLRKIISVGAKA